jgi:TetR/AcrR family transcriptional regulator, regulator of cefoperazone and chloramphenicol sensitivity
MRPIAERPTRGRSPASPLPRDDDEQGTRRRLLEAAGQIFADKGFDRATGKEICERAGTNTAAVNYYFGGMEGLYAAVLWEAHNRFVTFEMASAAVAGQTDVKGRLEAIIRLIIRTITGPVSSSWVLRVLGREILAASAALDTIREKEIVPKARLLRSIVSELMDLPEDHPAVARGCVSVLAPCFMLLLFDRRTLKRALPKLSLSAEDSDALVQHLVQFSLAGLTAVGSEARKQAAV